MVVLPANMYSTCPPGARLKHDACMRRNPLLSLSANFAVVFVALQTLLLCHKFMIVV